MPLLGFPVAVEPTDVDEQPLAGEAPTDLALRLAEVKARAARAPRADEVVVGADSVVELDGQPLGKPADAGEARRMLADLRGRQHHVVTAVALVGPNGSRREAVRTSVQMRPYGSDEIDEYVRSGRPLDKAGAYAIQDADFGPAVGFDGCYLNVVGLPLCAVQRGLAALGWPFPDEQLTPPCHWCEAGQAALEQPARSG